MIPLRFLTFSTTTFSSVGEKLASRVPPSCSFTEYWSPVNNPNSFFFDPVPPENIEGEVQSIPRNKTYGGFTLVRSIFHPVLNTLFLALYPTLSISLCKKVSFHPN